MTKRRLILSLNASLYGHHEASWRLPSARPAEMTTAKHFQELARLAERGKFDIFFMADFMAFNEAMARYAVFTMTEPLATHAAVAAVTKHIGLVATGSTTYGDVHETARIFSALDLLSKGRAGWNIVTSGAPATALNFNRNTQVPHHERYVHARGYVQKVLDLWDGRGSLDAAVPLQGYPLLVQAGSSEDGKDFAGRYGEVIFTAQTTIAQAKAFRDQVRAAAASYGRDPDSIKTLPGLYPIIASTQAEALALKETLDAEIQSEKIVEMMAGWGFDLRGRDVDGPFPFDQKLDPNWDGITSRFEIIRQVALDNPHLTVRGLVKKVSGNRGHSNVIGTPEQVADHITQWWQAEAMDGHMVMPSHMPGGLENFVDHVIPILQKRGIVQEEYAEGTLREKLGLKLPVPQQA